jgi:hypothetical protein
MALETGVRKDNERGVYVYYLVHDGAEIPFLERKFGNVDKRRKAAAEQAQQQQQTQQEPPAQGEQG